MRLSLFEQYMCTLARWGAYLSYVLVVVSVSAGDVGWSMFFTVIGSSLLGGALCLEDRR